MQITMLFIQIEIYIRTYSLAKSEADLSYNNDKQTIYIQAM